MLSLASRIGLLQVAGVFVCALLFVVPSAAWGQTPDSDTDKKALQERIDAAKSDVDLKSAKFNVAKAIAAVSVARESMAPARVKAANAQLALSASKVKAEKPNTPAHAEAESMRKIAEADVEEAKAAVVLAKMEKLLKEAEAALAQVELRQAEELHRKLVARHNARAQ